MVYLNIAEVNCIKMKILVSGIFIICFVNYVNADCGIISKKEWGGRSPSKVRNLPRPVSIVVIQHTMTNWCKTDDGCKTRVREIQDENMDIRQYWDIGPSFLVGGNGQVYEGSGWLRAGRHTHGYNEVSIAIALIGNYEDFEPPMEVMGTVKALIECGVQQGHIATDYKLVAHNKLTAMTESPGRFVVEEIATWPHYLDNVDSIKMI